MPVSQFKIYTSEDPQGPGPVTGQTGSLLRILNACLVDGYGTGSFYKESAGWSKPCSDSGSCYGAFKYPSGSQFALFVNDNQPTGVSYGEALMTGWMYVGPSASLVGALTPAQMVGGSGSYGQFPTPAQLYTYGQLNIRKSNVNTASPRQWMIAADAYTMYLWILTGDTEGRYYHYAFGDFFSLAGTSDRGRCIIYGRYSGQGGGSDVGDLIHGPTYRAGYGWSVSAAAIASYGHYVAAGISGFGGSQNVQKQGDNGLSSAGGSWTTNVPNCTMDGVFAYPNPTDNALHLSPLWIGDPLCSGLRGRLRGLYQPLHNASSFQNGMVISGSGDYAGKVFMMVERGANNGHWALEISNTVETN